LDGAEDERFAPAFTLDAREFAALPEPAGAPWAQAKVEFEALRPAPDLPAPPAKECHCPSGRAAGAEGPRLADLAAPEFLPMDPARAFAPLRAPDDGIPDLPPMPLDLP
jgi:hypothetical protein